MLQYPIYQHRRSHWTKMQCSSKHLKVSSWLSLPKEIWCFSLKMLMSISALLRYGIQTLQHSCKLLVICNAQYSTHWNWSMYMCVVVHLVSVIILLVCRLIWWGKISTNIVIPVTMKRLKKFSHPKLRTWINRNHSSFAWSVHSQVKDDLSI